MAFLLLLLISFLLICCYWLGNTLQKSAQDIISLALNRLLIWKYPIVDETGKKQLPGPSYEWPNGNGDVAKFMNGPANTLTWRKRHGSIYRIWAGMHPEVVLTRPEDVQAFFKDSDQHYKAVNNDSGYLLGELLGQCVGLLSRGEWKNLRARVEVPFLHKASIQYLPTINHHARAYVKRLEKESEMKNGTFDPVADMKMFPFLCIAQLVYGELSESQSQELTALAKLREDLWKHVMAGGLSRYNWSKYIPSVPNKMLAEFQSKWELFNLAAYERAKALSYSAPIIELWESCDNSGFERRKILQTLDETLFANLDVTTAAISWNLVNLASHPEDQQLVYEEIIASKPENGDEKIREPYMLDNGTHLAACINESARVRPIAAFSVPQSAPVDKVLGGWVIPKKTNLMVDSYSLNIRNEFWGADRELYRPSRWKNLSKSQTRYNMWRFGFGPRQCIGKYVAEKMLRVLLVNIVEHYEIGLTKDGALNVDPDYWLTSPQVTLSCIARS